MKVGKMVALISYLSFLGALWYLAVIPEFGSRTDILIVAFVSLTIGIFGSIAADDKPAGKNGSKG